MMTTSAPSEVTTKTTFSAAEWHRRRRREILAAHPEVRALARESDVWVASLGALLLPCYAWVLGHASEMSPAELCLHAFGIGSLRATWAIYCGHAISHGRWRSLAGQFGSARFNGLLAACNLGHAFQVVPSYWLLHHSHHTRLGSLPLIEARERAKRGRQTDGDLGIATRLFSPPARKYRLVRDEEGAVLPRQSEAFHQAMSVVVHAIAPIAFAGYVGAALRTDRTADPALRRSLALQASAQLLGYCGVAALSAYTSSWAPLGLYLGSSLAWLSPLNPNWIWTCPHVCQLPAVAKAGASGAGLGARGTAQPQPTVSFYTPRNAAGAALDVYLGFENYHVEHHDFPEMPMCAAAALHVALHASLARGLARGLVLPPVPPLSSRLTLTAAPAQPRQTQP